MLEYRRAGLQKYLKTDAFDNRNGTNSGTHCADVQSVPATIGFDLLIDPVRSTPLETDSLTSGSVREFLETYR